MQSRRKDEEIDQNSRDDRLIDSEYICDSETSDREAKTDIVKTSYHNTPNQEPAYDCSSKESSSTNEWSKECHLGDS